MKFPYVMGKENQLYFDYFQLSDIIQYQPCAKLLFIKYFSKFKVQLSSAKIFHDKILLPTVNLNGILNTVVCRMSMSAITWPQLKQE